MSPIDPNEKVMEEFDNRFPAFEFDTPFLLDMRGKIKSFLRLALEQTEKDTMERCAGELEEICGLLKYSDYCNDLNIVKNQVEIWNKQNDSRLYTQQCLLGASSQIFEKIDKLLAKWKKDG